MKQCNTRPMASWITDRQPTAADADKDGNVYFEDANGYRSLCFWASPTLKGRPWLPLNDLPPVPKANPEKPKTQETLDRELAIKLTEEKPGIEISHIFANAIRADLKRQVREIIKDCPHIAAIQQLRELVSEAPTSREDAP